MLKIFHYEIRKILKSEECLVSKFSTKRLSTCIWVYHTKGLEFHDISIDIKMFQ